MRRLTLAGFVFIQALTLFGAERVRVAAAPEGGSPMRAQCTPDGAIHLLYERNNEPFYVKSTDGGATFSTPVALVDDAAKKPGLEFSIWDMAQERMERSTLCSEITRGKLKLPKDQWGLFFTTLEPGAKSFAPLRNINHEPSEGFSIATDTKGNVALMWLKGKVMCALSRDGGKTFSPGAELNPSYNPCPCCTTAATYGTNGNLEFIYREATNNDRDIFMVSVTPNGQQNRQRASTTLWSVNSCPMSYFNISPIKDGYAAAWPTRGEVYFTRFSNDGKPLPPGEIRTPGHTGMRCTVVTMTNPSGETLVAWNDDGKLGWQIYDESGKAAGAAGSAPSRGKGVAAVVGKDGGFIVFP